MYFYRESYEKYLHILHIRGRTEIFFLGIRLIIRCIRILHGHHVPLLLWSTLSFYLLRKVNNK